VEPRIKIFGKNGKEVTGSNNDITKVLRDGKWIDIAPINLVPGDIISFSEGTTIPADIRLITCENVGVDCSALTGESYPVTKSLNLGDNKFNSPNLIPLGSKVKTGSGTGIVYATWANTFLGMMQSDAEDKG
jgi:Ca2+-transporting ATPase